MNRHASIDLEPPLNPEEPMDTTESPRSGNAILTISSLGFTLPFAAIPASTAIRGTARTAAQSFPN